MREINIDGNIMRSGLLGLTGLLITPLCIRKFNNVVVRVDGDVFGNIVCSNCPSFRNTCREMVSVKSERQRLVMFGTAIYLGGDEEMNGTSRAGGHGEGSPVGVVVPFVKTYTRDGEVVGSDFASGKINAQRRLFFECVVKIKGESCVLAFINGIFGGFREMKEIVVGINVDGVPRLLSQTPSQRQRIVGKKGELNGFCGLGKVIRHDVEAQH